MDRLETRNYIAHLQINMHLHSSMDRLETLQTSQNTEESYLFTFQYGQIRNERVKALARWDDMNLHSSMDRLETTEFSSFLTVSSIFTFQYGQIRNACFSRTFYAEKQIYIPVWIDQKQVYEWDRRDFYRDLHSSMDRLETSQLINTKKIIIKFTFQYGQIRNQQNLYFQLLLQYHLHSSMDRLETSSSISR